jgi:hypothetical protein
VVAGSDVGGDQSQQIHPIVVECDVLTGRCSSFSFLSVATDLSRGPERRIDHKAQLNQIQEWTQSIIYRVVPFSTSGLTTVIPQM